jgi:hypothetical protein
MAPNWSNIARTDRLELFSLPPLCVSLVVANLNTRWLSSDQMHLGIYTSRHKGELDCGQGCHKRSASGQGTSGFSTVNKKDKKNSPVHLVRLRKPANPFLKPANTNTT